MGCFFQCCDSKKPEVAQSPPAAFSSASGGGVPSGGENREEPMVPPRVDRLPSVDGSGSNREVAEGPRVVPDVSIPAKAFTFLELATATGNFRPDCYLGEGGFGRVHKGRLESTGQIVAVKQLDRNGVQGNKEFLNEVFMLSHLHHPNLVSLIGYCADGDQRLLVYEFMSLGSLEDHLHDLPPEKEGLDWNTRMKIAAGAAKGLEYLHDTANPPVIYRDFKSSNILLDAEFHPKLSDFGLAKHGPTGDKSHVSTRVMGTYGYCAPEYAMTGQLTVKSDVYGFGVVLLELITGRKAIDSTRSHGERNLITWARPLFNDRKKTPGLVDPRLQGRFPMHRVRQALEVAFLCIQDEAASRPPIAHVVCALSHLVDPNSPSSSTRSGGEHRLGGEKIKGKNIVESSDRKRDLNNKGYDRERLVAEAKMWGEKNLRGKTRASTQGSSSADG